MAGKYRIALLVDGPCAEKWVIDLLEWTKAHPRIELAAVIVAPANANRTLDTLLKLESRFLLKREEYRAYARRISIAGRAPVEIHLRNPMGMLGQEELSKLEDLELDALVRCGREVPEGEILKTARDGAIAVLGCGDRERSASQAGFAEVLDGKPDTKFTIERLKHDGVSREILFSGSVATALFYAWNVIALQARAFPYLQLTLERLAYGTVQCVPHTNEHAAPARATDVLSYAARAVGRSFRKVARSRLGREFNWQVAFAREELGKLDFGRGNVVPNPEGAFLADPFAIHVDGADYLFVEEFSFETRKGVISAYRLEGEEALRIGVVLEEPYHLSYPFLFRHDGEIYMVPEGGGGRSITLYKSTSFPTGWTKVKVLMADTAAVDTVIFEHDDLWWMFTTIQGEGPGLNNAELHAFYAKDPLGEWTPHEQNPIVMNAMKGRNGGFVRDCEGNPCRVAQAPGFTFYGASSSIYRIDALTPQTYRETLVREVRPTFFPKLDGTHHVHSASGLTVFDFMRVERPRGRRAKPRTPKWHAFLRGEGSKTVQGLDAR